MKNKIEEFLFYLLLVVIPFNLRKIFYYQSLRFSEWEAISLFFTDMLLILLFGFWFINNFSSISQKLRSKIQSQNNFLVIFIIIALVSIKEVNNFSVGIYHWLKLLEFSLFYLYLKNYALQRFDQFRLLLALLMGGFFQAIIAISQFIKQSSIGLSIFGESLLDPSMGGVAAFYNSVGEKIMRGYGTTPHSNVLAGYLLLVIFASYFLWSKYVFYFPDKKPKILFLTLFSVVIFGFLTSFSRTTVFAWLSASIILAVFVHLTRKDMVKSSKTLTICVMATVFLFGGLYLDESLSRLKIDRNEEAVQLRIYFAEESLEKTYNLLGVGWGNFVPWLMEKNPSEHEWLYQPVHNVYLLVYSETGILGFLFFGLFLLFVILRGLKNKNTHVLICLLAFMFIAFFDHYFLTLQQGNLIWWGILGTYAHLKQNI